MNINAATTTRDILGLAVLAVLHEKPSSRAETVDTVRALCMPWLTPSRDVLAGLVTEYCNLRFLHVDGNPQCRAARDPDDGCIEITEDGERELRRLAVYRTRQPAHSLVVLCESLRLSVAHRLDPETHEEILRGQICARRRCLAAQCRRLSGTGNENPMVAHIRRHQIACARAELDELTRENE